MIQFRYYLLPLFAVKLERGLLPNDPACIRYLGVSFHINDLGDIATCAHVADGLKDGESLVAFEMYGGGKAYLVENFRGHPKHDFAVGRVRRTGYSVMPIHGKREIFIGTDIMSYGFTSDGLVKNRYVSVPRLFKGYIVRTHEMPLRAAARSTCEISFPSHNGFSGAPLFFDREKTSIAGMLYGNQESTITLHKVSQVTDQGDNFSEEIHRVVELGAAHTAFDIRCFLNDLGITRVALDTKEPDEPA